MYTYSDTHTGEWDNYPVASDDGQTVTILAYHAPRGAQPGDGAYYTPDASGVYRRTSRTVEGEDPDAWEPNPDVYSPQGHDVRPDPNGDAVAINGIVYEVDRDAEAPATPPNGYPVLHSLQFSPSRPGWPLGADDTDTLTVTVTLQQGDTARTLRDMRENLPAMIRDAWGVNGSDLAGFDGPLVTEVTVD